jgi:hypothetical protein
MFYLSPWPPLQIGEGEQGVGGKGGEVSLPPGILLP